MNNPNFRFFLFYVIIVRLDGHVKLIAPIMNRISLVLDGYFNGIALRVAQVPAWSIQTATFHLVSVDGIADSATLWGLETRNVYLIPF